jgi:hypothetical protein
MAHYARVVDGLVVNVYVLANAVITDSDGVEQEELGQVFLAELYGHDPAELVQCSYNGSIRGHYPGVGWSYDSVTDLFVAPAVPEISEGSEVSEVADETV